jgi:hypothetical protein
MKQDEKTANPHQLLNTHKWHMKWWMLLNIMIKTDDMDRNVTSHFTSFF